VTIRILEGNRANALLRTHCDQKKVPVQAVIRLVEIENEHVGSGRRHAIFTQIDQLLSEFTEATDASR
jgi:hypothetical protein